MKLRLLLFGLLLASLAPVSGQENEIDVTTLLADTKTFIFSDNQSTVKGYIYAQLEAQTSCCGKDRIYLEVKIDPSGYVLSAKTLTGRNDCFMQSAVDIVKNIKWNTEDFKGGPRSVYFEIKPDLSCDGGRANEYAAIEVFNNELLNGTGTATPTAAATPQTPPASQPQAPAEEPEPEVTEQPAVAAADEPEPEVVQQAPEPVQESDQPAEEPAPTMATADPEPEPEETQEEPADEPVVVETIESRTETPSSPPGTMPRREESAPVADVSPTDPPRGQGSTEQQPAELTPEQEEAMARQEAERQRREEEIRQLKEEMARMRAAEEQIREDRMAEDQRRREQEQNDPYAYGGGNDEPFEDNGEPNGGLFLDDLPYEEGENQTQPGADQTDPAASQEERIRNDIARLDQQIRELEQKNREAENAVRQQMAEAERANREIIQLAEEKARREEEAEQLREQRELDRIAERRRQVEEARARQEQEVQRLTDELARLESEMQTKMDDLERQEDEIDEISMQRQQREQEIQLTRALREKEREAELERLRLEKMNGALFASEGINTANIPTDFATAADSEKYMILQAQIQTLINEVNSLRAQLGQAPLEQTVPGTQPDARTGNQGTGTYVTPDAGGGNTINAEEDRDWEDIDYVAPGLSEEDYMVRPRPQATPTASTSQPPSSNQATNQSPSSNQASSADDPSVVNYRPGRGYSPDPSHSETHENSAGPQLSQRTYVQGEGALKDLVKENLRNGGVCGLAHVLFSVTLKPDGSVVSYRILSANSPQVSAEVSNLIPNLRYNPVDARYNQTVYQEIKAEIVCEGTEDVNLQSVQPIIRE